MIIENLALYFGSTMIVLFIIWAIRSYIQDRRNQQPEYDTQELVDFRNELEHEVETLLDQREQLWTERRSSLHIHDHLKEALDRYENAHIRISSDIIEDASVKVFGSSQEAVKFIENQRYAWKLENGKKVL